MSVSRGRSGAAPVRAVFLVLALAAAGIAGWALGLAQGRRASGGAEAAPGGALPGAPTTAIGLQDLGPAPRYRLTDQAGRAVDSDSLLGKVRVVTFLFPYCRTYCPLVAAHLRGLETELRSAGLADRVQLVAFNVDPAGADASRMRDFLREYGWDPSSRAIAFLTGDSAKIRRVVTGGYHVAYRRVAAADTAGALTPQPEVVNPLADSAAVTYDVVHNDAIELVDPKGRIRRYYGDADRVSDQRLLSDIRTLLGERGR